MNQFETKILTPTEFINIVNQMDQFISTVLPILPGNKQLYQIADIYDSTMPKAEEPEFTQTYSIAQWNWMKSLTNHASLISTPISFICKGKPYNFQFLSGVINTVLQSERDGWSTYVKSLDSEPEDTFHQHRNEMLENIRKNIDTNVDCAPPLSIRHDLYLKFLLETAIQRNKSKGKFNPDSDRRRNDAIDSLLNLTFLLPGFVCTLDLAFTSRFDAIDSFQKGWIITPNQLAERWTNGENPTTTWTL